MLLLALTNLATAADDPAVLTAGELRHNAFTLENGDMSIRPLFKSHFGVHERIDVKVPILGTILGPRGSVELGLVQSDGFAMSLEPEVAFGWGFQTRVIGGSWRATFGGPTSSRFNLNVGAFHTHLPPAITDTAEFVTVPVDASFDLVPNERTVWRFYAQTEVLGLAEGVVSAAGGFNWNHSFGPRFRTSLGVLVGTTGVPAALSDVFNVDGDGLPPILPLPTIELWWMI